MSKPPIADLYISQTLSDRFLIKEYIGSGNFSLVFAAYDNLASREVAVKILLPSPAAEDRIEFDTECELLSLAKNAGHVIDRVSDGEDAIHAQVPNTNIIVPLLTRYLTLERASKDLGRMLAVRSNVPWPDRLSLYRNSVKGLHQLHLLKIAHRDLKADNILVLREKRTSVAKIADLGRSKLTTKLSRFDIDSYLAGRGDLRYAPPEFLFHLGDQDNSWRPADLYYVGSLLFEVATGQGLTTASLGDIRGILGWTQQMTDLERQQAFAARENELQARYESSYLQFRHELPVKIRNEGERLLRQLTAVDPAKREPVRYGKKATVADGLQWVLRRVDIMILQLAANRQASSRRKKA